MPLSQRTQGIPPVTPFRPMPAFAAGDFALGLLLGLTSLYDVEHVGHIYLVEFFLAPIGLAGLSLGLLRPLVGPERRRLLGLFAIAALGYVVSDVLRHTASADYLRGWARLFFLLTDSLGFLVLLARRRSALPAYLLGCALAGLFLLLREHTSLQEWKFGWATPLALVVVFCAWWWGEPVGAGILAITGAVNVFMDYKSLGGVCFLAAFLAAYARWGRNSVRALRALLAVTLLPAAVIGGTFIYHIAYRDDQKAVRSQGGEAERQAALMAASRAIVRSPIFGYGSWAKDADSAAYYIERRAALEGNLVLAKADNVNDFDRDAIQSHSQILQAWTEGGILAAAFFIYYAVLLFWALAYVVRRRPYDHAVYVHLYVLLLAIWDAFFSPFAGDHRMSIGLAAALTLWLLTAERTRVTTMTWNPMMAGSRA